MCGIVGLIHPSSADPTGIHAMVTAVGHRGPDSHGAYTDPDAFVSLGHARLSIFDTSAAGHQPMVLDPTARSSPTAGPPRAVLTFNGEIYNYRELRRDLERDGVTFRTGTDTEVLLHGLARFGHRFLHRCNGMFALAFYRPAERRLLLARDRTGQKPLAIGRVQIDGQPGLAFASELSAFAALARAHDGASVAIDHTSVLGYLLNDYVPPPRTILRGVWKLPPGHWLELRTDPDHWPDPSQPPPSAPYWQPTVGRGRATAADFEARLADAVRLRLRADVPLGVFLSGGIDSSLVLALTRREITGDLHTFSIGFREASFDESPHARRVADHFGTTHHERVISVEDLRADVPAMLDHMDEPFADHSLLPTRAVSKLAREQVTVALGGDGADELFAGYAPFVAWSPGACASILPAAFWREAERWLSWLPTSDRYLALDFKLLHFLKGLRQPAPCRHQAWMAPASPRAVARLTRHWAHDIAASFHPWQVASETFRRSPRGTARRGRMPTMLDRQILAMIHSYLAEDILTKVDRASMAVALEARSPFLDHRVFETALQLPDREKFRWPRSSKVRLREMARRLVPVGVADRPKQGFGIPLAAWLRGPLRQEVHDTLARQTWFDASEVARLMREHESRRRNHQKILWALFIFSAWIARQPYGVA